MIKLTEHLDKISETPVEYQYSTTVLQWIISLGWFYCSWPQNLGWKEVFNGALCSFWGKEFQWDVWFYVGQTLCFFATEQTNTASHRSDCHDTGVCCSVTSRFILKSWPLVSAPPLCVTYLTSPRPSHSTCTSSPRQCVCIVFVLPCLVSVILALLHLTSWYVLVLFVLCVFIDLHFAFLATLSYWLIFYFSCIFFSFIDIYIYIYHSAFG